MALVCGTASMNRSTYGGAEYNHILTHFSPRSKGRAQIANMPHDKEIDLLIATDCISEGQNLQDCDLVINSAALKDIEQRFRQRSVNQLQHSRTALLPTSAPSTSQSQQFELITWLVIR